MCVCDSNAARGLCVCVQMQAFFKRTFTSEQDAQVFASVYMFNRKVLKTNFFKDIKVALSFRMDPTFLSREEYPEIPFGLFFVIGSEFRGFHVRFRDVARGGIRVVKSPNLQVLPPPLHVCSCVPLGCLTAGVCVCVCVCVCVRSLPSHPAGVRLQPQQHV